LLLISKQVQLLGELFHQINDLFGLGHDLANKVTGRNQTLDCSDA